MQTAEAQWSDTFAQLSAIVSSPRRLAAQFELCRGVLRARAATLEDGPLKEDVLRTASSLLKLRDGDSVGNVGQFDQVLEAHPAGEERFFGLALNEQYSGQATLVLARYRLQARVSQAHGYIRSERFIRPLARRLGLELIPDDVFDGKLQGMEVVEGAGDLRYAVFGDFVYGRQGRDASGWGGFVLSTLTDDFLQRDLPIARRMFPRLAERLESLGILQRERLLFLYPLLMALHGTLGHRVPHPSDHWVKLGAGRFLFHAFNQVGADSHFFWMATAPEMRPLMLELVPPEILAIWPHLWLMKRFAHYIARGTDRDPIHGNLMEDSDCRAGVLLWSFLRKHGAVVKTPDGTFDFDDPVFAVAADRLVQEWLEVENRVPAGIEAYASGVCDFNRRYGTPDPITGRWTIPEELRPYFAR